MKKELGDKQGAAMSLHELGVVEREQGNYAAAREYLQQALALEKEIGYKEGNAATLEVLGAIELSEGNQAAAENDFVEGWKIAQEIGHKFWIAYNQYMLARVKALGGNRADAIQLAQAALALWEKLRAPEAKRARELLAQLGQEP